LSKIPNQTTRKINWKKPGFLFKGFSVQLFLITILPLTALLLVVAFGSQSLHNQAMRSLVGDRDLQTVRATANSLDRELSHLASTIQLLARSLGANSDLSSLILQPSEISAAFDGGIALYSKGNQVIRSTSASLDWQNLSVLLPNYFSSLVKAEGQPVFSTPVISVDSSQTYVLVGSMTSDKQFLIGAFSPARLINSVIADLVSAVQTSVLVISPNQQNGNYSVLYQGGPFQLDESTPTHPGIREGLNGESGISYYQSSTGEHVVAFSPIPQTGWGLIIEEAWGDIADPYLVSTQSAPLVIVPIFLLALVALWFGARRIVTPLQKLEKQAASLALGDFEAIREPVGGIDEIRNLQTELVEMADKLKAAQQSLRSYIGAITAGIETERRSLARELHDDTIQALIALNQRIQLILMNSPETQKDVLGELHGLVQQSMTNLRRMIRGLRPIYLEDLGLIASLEMLVREMEQPGNLQINFSSRGLERRLDPQVEMSLYRMAQESLNNVVHHANAKHAWVDLDFGDKELTVQIRDDGVGFLVPTNPAEFPEKGHFGLLGLHERSELINADLEIVSSPGSGTTVSIRLPINSRKDLVEI